MNKILAVVVALVGVAIGAGGCSPGTTKIGWASDKPYVDYPDLFDRGVPTDGFSMTGFALETNNTIELRFNTYGKPEDKKLIEPTIEKAKYLTQNLRKKYPIRVVFIDGNPHMTMDDKPVGTGEVIREVILPITQ
jgi:hypothetical protein